MITKQTRAKSITALFAVMISYVLFFTISAQAQDCSPNMLSISNSGSYVVTPDVQSLHLTNGFTIELWAKSNSYLYLAGLIDKGNGGNPFYGLYLDTGQRILARVKTNLPVRLDSPPIPSASSWHHYAIVFAPRDSLYFYLDGVEVASRKVDSALQSSTDSLRIGMSSAGATFIGSIDELRIWNFARTAASISADRGHTISGKSAGLVLYYPFDDETGANRIHDFSGHGNDGLIRGNSVEILPTTSPVTTPSQGFRLDAREIRLIIPDKRCVPTFDTVIHIRNLGTDALLVNSIGFYRGQAFSVTPDVPVSLPADSSRYQDIHIHFAPQSGGVFDDSLFISSTSDNCAGSLRIGIHAVYDSVGLTASPSVLQFGPVTQCEVPSQAVTVRNTSTTDSVTILGSIIPSWSGLLLLTPLPLTLAPNESRSISVAFGNGARGNIDAPIKFNLDKCSRQATIEVQGIRQHAELGLPGTIQLPTLINTLTGVTFDTTIVLRNSGDVGTVVSAISLVADSGFSLGPIAHPFLNPSDTAHILLHFHSDQCGHFEAKLNALGYTCAVDTTTRVIVDVAAPPPISVQPLDVGNACILKDTAITLTNPGDLPVRIDTITFNRDAVYFTPYGSFPRILAPHSSITDSLRFAPGLNGEYDVTAYIHSTPCGLQSVALRGAKGITNVLFDTPSLDFGRGCDTTPIARQVTLRNRSSRNVTILDTSYRGSGNIRVEAIQLPIVLRPGESRDIKFDYRPRLGYIDTAIFSLFGPEGCPVTALPIRGSREISTVDWSAQKIDFDTVCAGSLKTISFSLHNSGIDTLDVFSASIAGSGFTLIHYPQEIAKDSVGIFWVQFSPTAAAQYPATLSIIVSSCGTTFTIPLLGSGGPRPTLVVANNGQHDFGSVRVGDTTQYCLQFTNPSCTPLILTDSSFVELRGAYELSAASRSRLPISVVRGSSATLCFDFIPSTYGSESLDLPVSSDSVIYTHLAFHGTGLAPKLRVSPKLLDFGYVLHGDLKVLPVGLRNVGNDTAYLNVHTAGGPEYSTTTLSKLAPNDSATIFVTFQPTQSTGFKTSELRIDYNTHTDTVQLRGQGTDKGMLLSALGIAFGDVHVRNPVTKVLAVTAAIDLPTIIGVSVPISDARFFAVAPERPLPYTLTSDHDTLRISVTYQAPLEETDTSTLTVTDGTGRSIGVPLTGRGVEAHPLLHAEVINFGPVLLGDTVRIARVLISDTGFYPLYITGVHIGSHFIVTPDLPNQPLAPGEGRTYTIEFAPKRVREVLDTLSFETSSPDKIHSIILRGSGKDSIQNQPAIEFSVSSVTVKAGDHVAIPVSISGTNLSRLDVDSLQLFLRYDPTMVAFSGVEATSGNRLSMKRIDDSTIGVAVTGKFTTPGVIFLLDAEALLGTRQVTFIQVDSANPAATVAALSNDGMFTVSDCGGALHGVAFTGDYQLHPTVPNPAANIATIRYRLGLDGDVRIQLFNSQGSLSSDLFLSAQKSGEHSVMIPLSGTPSGRYMYRVQSLDYSAEGVLIVQH